VTARARFSAALLLALGAAVAAPSPVRAAEPARVIAHAGLHGSARPGRWLPVDVTITTADAPLRGTLTAEWGDAVTRQDVDLPPGATARLTLTLRAIAAAPTVQLSLTPATGDPQRVDLPVAMLPVDATVQLCVGSVLAETPCTIHLAADDMPDAFRTFDLADTIISEPDTSSSPTLAFARAVRWWRDSAIADPTSIPFDRQSASLDHLSAMLAGTLALGLFAVLAAVHVPKSAWLVVGTPLVMGMGAAIWLATADAAPGLQVATVVHQFDGVSGSLVMARGEVEHSGSTVELTPTLTDGAIETDTATHRADSQTTRDGIPVYRAAAGLGTLRPFDLEGRTDAVWLAVGVATATTTLRNVSAESLTDCEWRGAVVESLGSLAPGDARRIDHAPVPGDVIVCRVPPDVLHWRAPRSAGLDVRGSAFVMYHFWPGAGDARAAR